MDIEQLPIFELKELSDDGSFTGIASVYGVEDLGGDVIEKGAFTKTIQENPSIPILWHHKSEEVIGEGSLKEWQGKVMLSAKLDLSDPTAQKAHAKMKAKLIKGLSIGFSTIKSTFGEMEGRMIRRIQELKLWEVSVVTFPLLPSAQITRVKSADAQDARFKALEDEIRALKANQAATPAEPAQAKEPPVSKTEPVADHSGLSSLIDQAKEGFKWTR